MNMDSLPINKRFHCNAPLPPPFIPNEIVAEILCLLPVQTILQLRCVSKAWKTLISGPTFVQKHFKKSSENPHLLFISDPFPMRIDKSVRLISLFETDPWIIVSNDNFLEWLDLDNCQVVGSCKGLLCLFFHHRYQNYWFWLWNPATRTLSEKLGTFQEYVYDTIYQTCKFTFGCDISSGNYKVVALSRVEVREENTLSVRSQFRVMSLGDNRWRTFQYCASIPVCLIYPQINNGLHLNGTVNWLALPKYIKPSSKYDWKSIDNAQQFVIVSLDLSSETCTQFLLPPGFEEVPCFQPALNVLMDCLCFSHDFKGIQFVIWQMKEFGVQESWTMLFKINYFDIQMLYPNIDNISDTTTKCGTLLLPLYLSKNGDTLILANYAEDLAMIYNQREKTVKRIRIANKLCLFSTMDYVESLVSAC
ncbi:F-box/kelch-repeat protein At3g23880-like [Vicia villosa]|uniref:F-box/kelch-repeat protein At3g23880-like n=1 Tax=Vicia villosa TaxID=3911 RepID=UPI00273C9234|nr:F-box/kelch-repeat protein At3g23880-like [Vicia villosa]